MNDMKQNFLAYPSERVALLVDGSNTYIAGKNIQLEIDYAKLVRIVTDWGVLFRSVYFTSLTTDLSVETPMVKLIDFLEYNGWQIIDKPMTESFDNLTGEKRRRSVSLAVDIAMVAFELAVAKADHIVLCSGDGNLLPMVLALQRRGVRVTVISTVKNKPEICSDDLRRSADNFVDLADIKDTICREREKIGG